MRKSESERSERQPQSNMGVDPVPGMIKMAAPRRLEATAVIDAEVSAPGMMKIGRSMEKQLRIPPLRFASVGMTPLRGLKLRVSDACFQGRSFACGSG